MSIAGPLVSTQDRVVDARGRGRDRAGHHRDHRPGHQHLPFGEARRSPRRRGHCPVTYGNNVFVPLFRTGEVAVFRLDDAALVRRIPVAQAGHSFELFGKDGVLWVNDAASEQALVINDGGVVRRIDKTANAALAIANGVGGGPRTGAPRRRLAARAPRSTAGGASGGSGSGETADRRRRGAGHRHRRRGQQRGAAAAAGAARAPTPASNPTTWPTRSPPTSRSRRASSTSTRS